MNNEILHRLDEYLKRVDCSYYKLEKDLEVSRGSISGALKHDRNLGSNVVENILKYFPKLSAEWLMRGVGNVENDRPNTLHEPGAVYENSKDTWLINHTIKHLNFHNKSDLIDFFKRLDENKENTNLSDIYNKLEKLDATMANLMLDIHDIKNKKIK